MGSGLFGEDFGGRTRRGRASTDQERRQLRSIRRTTLPRLRRDLRDAHRHFAASSTPAGRRDKMDLRGHQRVADWKAAADRYARIFGLDARSSARSRASSSATPARSRCSILLRASTASRLRKSPTPTSRWAASINAAATRSTCLSSRLTTPARSSSACKHAAPVSSP